MSCNLELTADGLTFKNVNLKYISTKTDNYGSEFSCYAILNENFKDIIKLVSSEMKTPYFLGKEDNYLLKIKTRYLTEEQKISGTATIKMKVYSYEQFNGYFVNGFEIK